jgi:hypothetical protein
MNVIFIFLTRDVNLCLRTLVVVHDKSCLDFRRKFSWVVHSVVYEQK